MDYNLFTGEIRNELYDELCDELQNENKKSNNINVGKVMQFNTYALISTTCISGDLFIYGTNSGIIYVRNIYSGKIESILKGHRLYVTHIHCNNGLIISCSFCHTIRIWDITRPSGEECIRVLYAHNLPIVTCCSINNLIISGSRDETIRIWDISRPIGEECIKILKGHTGPIKSVCVQNNLIVSGAYDDAIRVWDITNITNKKYTGKQKNHDLDKSLDLDLDLDKSLDNICVKVLKGHYHCIIFANILDNIIISCSFDDTICIWDLTKPSGNELINVLKGHRNLINHIYVNNNLIVSSSIDKTIRVWDLQKSISESHATRGQECIRVLNGLNDEITYTCTISSSNICRNNDSDSNSGTSNSGSDSGSDSGSANLIVSLSNNSNIYIWDITRPIGKECIYALQNSIILPRYLYIKDNIIITCSNEIQMTPIILFPGEYELFSHIINTYKLIENLTNEIWNYMS